MSLQQQQLAFADHCSCCRGALDRAFHLWRSHALTEVPSDLINQSIKQNMSSMDKFAKGKGVGLVHTC